MIEALNIIETNLGIGIDSIILILITLSVIIFSARSFDIGLIVGLVLYSVVIPFYYLMGWDYATPIKIVILCLILMAISIYNKSSGETII